MAPSSRRVLRPAGLDEEEVAAVRVSPDGSRIAFVRTGEQGGIWISEAGERGTSRCWVPARGWRGVDVRWSPDGSRIAYRMIGRHERDVGVGWASAASDGELGQLAGTAFAWTPKSDGLLVAEPSRCVIVHQAMAGSGAKTEVIAALHDEGDLEYPTRLAPSPTWSHVAYTARKTRADVAELWLLERRGATFASRLVTEIPGAACHVIPFWSPRGHTLGLHCVHVGQSRSAIVALPHLEGDGVILYQSEAVDAPEPAAWSPSAEAMVVCHGEVDEVLGVTRQRLLLLDFRAKTAEFLGEPDEVVGTPWFLDARRLVVDGGRAAHVFSFESPL